MPVSDQQQIYAYNIAKRIKKPFPELDKIPSFIEENAAYFDLLKRFDRIKEIKNLPFETGTMTNYLIFIENYPPNGSNHGDYWPTIFFLECELQKVPGLYAFVDIDGTILYICKSKNLAQRIPQSYGERWGDFDTDGAFVDEIRYYPARESDIGILEMYLISKYKPEYNRDGKTEETTTIFKSDLDIERDFLLLPVTMDGLRKRSEKWRDFEKWLKKDTSG